MISSNAALGIFTAVEASEEDTVKAIVQETYGPPRDVLELRDVAEPAAGDGEVLIRVRAASVNPADWHLIRGDPRIARLSFGLRAPKDEIPGCDLAGEVEAVGKDVTGFEPGEEVYGCTFMRGFGAFAELAAVPADLLAAKPSNLSFEQAAAVPVGGLTALQGLRDHGEAGPGTKVLVIGAGGGVGTFAVQIAKHLGAEVTAVCGTSKLETVRGLGADHVIDYTEEDFTRGGAGYDLILQLAGEQGPSELRRTLAPDGRLALSSGESDGRWVGPITRTLKAAALSRFVGQKLFSFTVSPTGDDLRVLTELIEAGKVAPVIDRTYSLDEVPEAIGYLEDGHTRGKIVIASPRI
jgi:NADPH:quinone reductase-like Zn-dependent oxidoreductase